MRADCQSTEPPSSPAVMVSSGNRTEVSTQQRVQMKIAAGSVHRPAVTRPCSLLFLIISRIRYRDGNISCRSRSYLPLYSSVPALLPSLRHKSRQRSHVPVRYDLSVLHGCSGMENDAFGSGGLFQAADREAFFVCFRITAAHKDHTTCRARP